MSEDDKDTVNILGDLMDRVRKISERVSSAVPSDLKNDTSSLFNIYNGLDIGGILKYEESLKIASLIQSLDGVIKIERDRLIEINNDNSNINKNIETLTKIRNNLVEDLVSKLGN